MAASLSIASSTQCRALELGLGQQHPAASQHPQHPNTVPRAGDAAGEWHSLPLSWRSAAASLEVSICITVRAGSLEHLHLHCAVPRAPSCPHVPRASSPPHSEPAQHSGGDQGGDLEKLRGLCLGWQVSIGMLPILQAMLHDGVGPLLSLLLFLQAWASDRAGGDGDKHGCGVRVEGGPPGCPFHFHSTKGPDPLSCAYRILIAAFGNSSVFFLS